MKKLYVFLLFLCFSILVFIGCNNLDSKISIEESTTQKTISNNKVNEEIEKLKEEISRLNEELKRKEASIKCLMEQKDYYKQSIDFMLEKLSEDELKEIMEKEWWYTLSIIYNEGDDKKDVEISFPKNCRITLDKSDFDLVFSEHNKLYHIINATDKYKKIYEEVLIRNWSDNIKVKNYDKYSIAAGSGTVVDSIAYQFRNVPNGTKIEIELSEKLKQKLGLEDNILIISIK
ncbi:hypothetical protein [Caloranaerobacter azorensis]|uniref:Uncharacterized protein n=1 Tax=Caloranaerobacter azorensis TaxID=116090 RepID=A0A6P1YB48_9FIRM|nr:hypothetical protein [Caloranaerobacter azorensis]QIB25923.1 hypothetical protein G3A45_00470 [Caloranaerobacter azorensis]